MIHIILALYTPPPTGFYFFIAAMEFPSLGPREGRGVQGVKTLSSQLDERRIYQYPNMVLDGNISLVREKLRVWNLAKMYLYSKGNFSWRSM